MRAPKMKKGGTVGICAPSHVATKEGYKAAVDGLKKFGYNVVEASNLYKNTYGYIASPEERAADFNELIADKRVDLVLFGGGEGSNELLPYIDFEAIKANPKRISSFSDGTTILNSVWANTGLETYYGFFPSIFADMSEYDEMQFANHIAGDSDRHVRASDWTVLRPGKARGVMTGGYVLNYAMLMTGKYFPVNKNEKHILFLEGHEKFGCLGFVSALITHVEQSGFMDSVTGFLFGHFSQERNPDLLNMIKRLGDRYDIPAAYCDDFGHGVNHAILPIGREAVLDTDGQTILYL